MKDILPTLVISFCDNQAGLAALQKGMGRDENINRLLITTWQMIAAKQWHIHMEWVASHNNLSDKISRHDTSWVNYSEWTELTPDLTQFYKILCRIAQDETYAVHRAKSDLLQLSLVTNLSNYYKNDCIGRVGEGGPKMVRNGPPWAMTSDAASTQPGQKGGSPCSASEAVVEERSSMSCSTCSEKGHEVKRVETGVAEWFKSHPPHPCPFEQIF